MGGNADAGGLCGDPVLFLLPDPGADGDPHRHVWSAGGCIYTVPAGRQTVFRP